MALLASVLAGGPALATGPATGIDVTLPALKTFTMSGTVTQAKAMPVGGLDLIASGPAGSGFGATLSDGSYMVIGLPVGSYRLQVLAQQGSALQSGYYASAGANHFSPLLAGAAMITVGPGNRTGVDLRLPAASTISGTVLNPKGRPVRGALAIPSAPGVGAHTALTGEKGTFVIEGLSPARYTLAITAPTGMNVQSSYYEATGSAHFTIRPTLATRLTVPPSHSKLTIKLPAGFSISGQILDSSLVGIPDASVRAFSQFHVAVAQTRPDGTYTLVGLSPGDYRILVTPPTPSASLAGHYAAGGHHYGASLKKAALLTVGPSKTNVKMMLPTGLSISGTITDTSGGALAGVTVSAGAASAVTDAGGKYTVIGLAAHTYRIAFEAPPGQNFQSGWYGGGPNHFSASQAGSTQLTVGSNLSKINARIPAGLTISGTILGPWSVPVPFATVSALDSAFTGLASTAFNGSYLISGLSPGTYVVRIVPLPMIGMASGYYRHGATGNYTSQRASATGVAVGP